MVQCGLKDYAGQVDRADMDVDHLVRSLPILLRPSVHDHGSARYPVFGPVL